MLCSQQDGLFVVVWLLKVVVSNIHYLLTHKKSGG